MKLLAIGCAIVILLIAMLIVVCKELEGVMKKWDKEKKKCVAFLKEEMKETDAMLKKVYCENQCVPNLAVERVREENECYNRTIADLKLCFDEVIGYLENPENYISKKQIMMLQRKLSEKGNKYE